MLQILLPVLLALFHCAAVILIVTTEKESPDIALVWLLLITFLPVGGLLVYYLVDSTYKVKLLPKRRQMEAAEKPFVEEVRREAEKLIKSAPPEEVKDIVQLHAAIGSYYSEGGGAELFYDGASMFKRLFEDITGAKASVQIEFFMFRAKHDLGQKLLGLLSEKAREGVRVVLLYDRMGDYKTHSRDFDMLRKAGASVEKYMPTVHSMLIHSNFRLHRKIIVIDGEIAYTGGINVGDEYVNRGDKLHPWRDTSVRITGPAVPAMQARFLSDLLYVELQKPKRKRLPVKAAGEMHTKQEFKRQSGENRVGVQVFSGGPNINDRSMLESYVKMVSSAKKYLYIQSPYFVPGKAFRRALRIAAKSGVDVRLMLPGIPDHKSVYHLTEACARSMLGYGIKIYLHKGFLHSKTVVADDLYTCIGTINTDVISFHLNFELGILFYSGEIAKENKEVFCNDLKDCVPLSSKTPKGFIPWLYRQLAKLF